MSNMTDLTPEQRERLGILRIEAAGLYDHEDFRHVLRVSARGRSERQKVVGLFHEAQDIAGSGTLQRIGLTNDELRDVFDLTANTGDGESRFPDLEASPQPSSMARGTFNANRFIHYCYRVASDATDAGLIVAVYDTLDWFDPVRAGGLVIPDVAAQGLAVLTNALTARAGRAGIREGDAMRRWVENDGRPNDGIDPSV